MDNDAIAAIMDEDIRAAAIAYAQKHADAAVVGVAFIAGVEWMLKRVPQFYALATSERTTPSQGTVQR